MVQVNLDFSCKQASTLDHKKIIFNEQGQSTIEFIIGFSIVFSMILLFLRISMQYTNGYFLHYATFMASRTYMVVDVNDDESVNDSNASRRAKAVFDKFLVPELISGFDGEVEFISPDENNIPLFSGAVAEYKERLSPISMMGGETEINFRSESLLRREPGREYCLEQICKAMEQLGVSCTIHITYFDNGC